MRPPAAVRTYGGAPGVEDASAARPTVVGVDLGATKSLTVLLDPAGDILAESRHPTPASADAAIELVVKAVNDIRRDGSAIKAVGLGCPGWVDHDGVLRFAANLGGTLNIPVRRILEDTLQVPVHVDNDATCAAWAEFTLGAANGYTDAVILTVGTGIGAGVIAGGRLVTGRNGLAGEVGHMVVERNGPPCGCGRRGCWELFASGRALTHLAQLEARGGRAARILSLAGSHAEAVRGEHVSLAASEGDEKALKLLEVIAGGLALGIANLVHAFDPQLVVIGGGLAGGGNVLLKAVRRSLQGQVRLGPGVELAVALLGERAGAIGAARLAAESAVASEKASP